MIWIVGIGGALGAAARFIIGKWISGTTQTPFPLATWIVNITGSFLLGLLTQLHLTNHISELLWLFVGVGFCGAFTTFSTFGHETVTLLQANKVKVAVIYVFTSITVGLISAMIGFSLMS